MSSSITHYKCAWKSYSNENSYKIKHIDCKQFQISLKSSKLYLSIYFLLKPLKYNPIIMQISIKLFCLDKIFGWNQNKCWWIITVPQEELIFHFMQRINFITNAYSSSFILLCSMLPRSRTTFLSFKNR